MPFSNSLPISGLPSAGPILDDELAVIVQDEQTRQTTIGDIKSRVLCAWGIQTAFDPISDDTWETFSALSAPANTKNVIDVCMTGAIEVSSGSGCILIRLIDNDTLTPINGGSAILVYANATTLPKNYARGSICYYQDSPSNLPLYIGIQCKRQPLESGTVFVSGGIASLGATGDSTVRIFRVG